MTKGRLEAFSDGVIAIIITVMVLELRIPAGVGWGALVPLYPIFLSYALSFVFLGIYWNNHHHLFQAVRAVYGLVLFFAACAYFILAQVLIAKHGKDSVIAKALGRDVKGKISVVLYAL